MKNINKNSIYGESYRTIVTILTASFVLGLAGPLAVFAAGPAAVNLGAAGNFVILAKTGISTTGATSITGDIGVSPAAASYITGFALNLPASSAFSTSALVTGKVYAPGYADPTPTNLTSAVMDMQTAYTDAAGRAADVTELGAGNIGGLTLVPGVYKWGTGVTIPTDVTLSGGANDVWIFQVAQNLFVSSAAKVVLAGGAQASNIFWQVAGQTTLGTTSVFNGNILDQTTIVMSTGATLNGRALAQAAVTLDANAVTIPTTSTALPVVISTQSTSTQATSTPVVYVAPLSVTSTSVTSTASTGSPQAASQSSQNVTAGMTGQVASATPASSNASTNAALQIQLNGLLATLHLLQAQHAAQQSASASNSASVASPFGQQVRAITTIFGKGSRGSNVTTLQYFLISQNKGPAAKALAKVADGPGGSVSYFGELTRAALAEFQVSVGIGPATGNFGPKTQAYLKANY